MVSQKIAGVNRITLDNPLDFLDWRMGSGSTVEIYDIQVGSSRGQGRGKELVQRLYLDVPRGCRLIWAITRSTNQVAQHFYEALGFRVVGVLREFYKDDVDGVDAVMYGKDVKR